MKEKDENDENEEIEIKEEIKEDKKEEIINTNSNKIEEQEDNNIIIEEKKENTEIEEKEEKGNFDELIINTEFNEIIYFNHFYLAQRQMDFKPKITGDEIPYMMSRDYLYSLFEDKKSYKNATNETYIQILGRVKQFMNSNDDNFNKIFLDHLTYYWEVLGKENSESILIPVLSKIVEDKINTRIYFLNLLKSFLEFLVQIGDDGIRIIKTNILNIIEQLYLNKITPPDNAFNFKKIVVTEQQKKEFDNLLFERLIQICKILVKSKYKEDLFNNILELTDDKDIKNDEKKIYVYNFKRIMGIKLLTHLASDFGEEFTGKNILPVLDNFFKDDNFKIKEEVGLGLIDLVKNLNIEFIGDYILNSLEILSNDKFWNIRKKCIEIIYKIISELKNRNKENEKNEKIEEYIKKMMNLIEKFIEDKNETVRNYLIEKIGEIIKVLISEKLFNFYIKTIEEYYNDEENLINIENKRKINFYFWYNFPAVLNYYGKEKWDELKDIYKYIIKDKDFYVINSVISSFYEICKILGKEITINELLPLYNNFFDEKQPIYVKDLAEKNIFKILSLLDKETREEYIQKYNIGFNHILNEEQKMNYVINNYLQNKKFSYLKNILTYYKLYDNETIYKNILSKCIYFSTDIIYKIRTKSCKIIAEIILYLYKNNYEKEKIIKLIGAYALNKKSIQRINFTKISKALLLVDNSLYEAIIKRLLFIIVTKEQNSNVLISLAKSLKKVITTENSRCGFEAGIHYLCKKINNGKNMSISRIFRNVKIQRSENIGNVGNIYEENMFVQNDIFFEKEFGIKLRTKNCTNIEINISNNNIVEKNKINEDNKFID